MQRWLPYAISLTLHLALVLVIYQVQSLVVPCAYDASARQIVMPKLGVAYIDTQSIGKNEPAIAELDHNPFEAPEFDGPKDIHPVQNTQTTPQATVLSQENDEKSKPEKAEQFANIPTVNQETPSDKILERQNRVGVDPDSDVVSSPDSDGAAQNDGTTIAQSADSNAAQNRTLPASKGSLTEKPNLNAANTNNLSPTPNADNAPLWEAYVKALNRHFSAKKFYPDMARKLGHRGTVWVSLKLSRSGALLNAQIETSSGSALLDRAALEAAQMAIPVPPFPPQTQENDRVVRIPYRYL